MKKFFLSLMSLATIIGANASIPSNTSFHRADSLLATMTLSEKIGQLNQLNCDNVTPQLISDIEQGKIGSLLNVGSPGDVNKLQKAAMRSSHRIPLLIARDVIHGYHTIFPIPLGQAALFDPNTVEAGARVAAVEASQDGIRWTFAPMLDIARDPRWGRIAESLGEDPYLASMLGSAMVKGFQGTNLKDASSMAACAKHFVGYGAAEGGRDYNTTSIPDRTLHNVYLPSFQSAIDAGALTVMSSFNANDGVPSTGNRHLLRNILRDEMGFTGLVVSDWNSVTEMIPHGFAADRKHAAELSLNAGLDMEMNSGTYIEYLPELIKQGKVSIKDIDEAVRRVLAIKFELGLFNNPYTDISAKSLSYHKDHLKGAEEAAAKSVILLKNDRSILPLDEQLRVALIGPMAHAPREQLGTWVFDGQPEHTVTPVDAMALKRNRKIKFTHHPILETCTSLDTTNFQQLDKAMANADAAVVFVGEEARLSGEAHSLSNINLIGRQSELLRKVKSYGKPVVAVVMAGRPLTIEKDLTNTDALIYAFHPGTMGGPALVDVLFGRVNPSAKLPVTFVREVGQIPYYYNHENTGRPAPENPKTLFGSSNGVVQTSAGDVSSYLDSGSRPLFPFGYGLSYTTFQYSPTTLSTTELGQDDTLTATATITNTGNRVGTEIVQLYVRDCVGSICRPVKELKGFQRITLNPGESKQVHFEIVPSRDLKFYNIEGVYKCEPGEFQIVIAPNSAASFKKEIRVIE